MDFDEIFIALGYRFVEISESGETSQHRTDLAVVVGEGCAEGAAEYSHEEGEAEFWEGEAVFAGDVAAVAEFAADCPRWDAGFPFFAPKLERGESVLFFRL